MKIYSIYILNKAGGLIYQNDASHGISKLTANDYLVLAGTIHGVHAIASKLKPSIHATNDDVSARTVLRNSDINGALVSTGKMQTTNANMLGLQSIETDTFNLYIFQSLTGVKFLLITSPNGEVNHPTSPEGSRGELNKQFELVYEFYKQIYISYADYVMKDPFYSMDMPIKSSLFEARVSELIA